MNEVSFLDILDRAHTGPVCTEKEWDMRVVPQAVAKMLKKYELERKYDPENPISCDDELADRFWEAGLELAVETGYLCISTERIIKLSREEILTELSKAPDRWHWHSPTDGNSIEMLTRKPEDPHPPITILGALGDVLPEELYVPITQSQAECWSSDGMVTGTLSTVCGRELRAATPYETLGGALEARLIREAMERAGRPGMIIFGVVTGALEYATIGGLGNPGGIPIALNGTAILSPSELKTDFHSLQKSAFCLIHHAHRSGAQYSMIGGYSGGPEGAAVCEVATVIFQRVVMKQDSQSTGVISVRYLGNLGRDCLWASSVEQQAVNRNTHLLTLQLINPVSGLLTESLLREVSVGAINGTVSGDAIALGVRTAGGKFPAMASGIECGLAGEVVKACAGMTREQGNEIVKQLLSKYEDELKRPNIGVTFPECYDVRTVKPKKEWADIYKKIKKEVAELGVPFARFE